MFLKGLILGFSIAAPVGPIGLLCIQRTLARGRQHGFVSGLGAATADAFYGLVAALGLGAITSFLLGLQFWLQLGGGLFLVWLGARSVLRECHVIRDTSAASFPGKCHVLRDTSPEVPAGKSHTVDDKSQGSSGLLRDYVSVLLLTLANPATILSFFAVFAGLGIGAADGTGAAVWLVAGVFLGSAFWWLLLSFIAGLLRGHLNDGRMRAVNIFAGGCIVALGLWSLWPVVAARF